VIRLLPLQLLMLETLEKVLMAEGEGFEPPIPFRV
jgi:hypothetical protein